MCAVHASEKWAAYNAEDIEVLMQIRAESRLVSPDALASWDDPDPGKWDGVKWGSAVYTDVGPLPSRTYRAVELKLDRLDLQTLPALPNNCDRWLSREICFPCCRNFRINWSPSVVKRMSL